MAKKNKLIYKIPYYKTSLPCASSRVSVLGGDIEPTGNKYLFIAPYGKERYLINIFNTKSEAIAWIRD